MDLDGYALGGLAVGETHEEMYNILEKTVPYLPEDKPTYLMGVGTPVNILEAVDRGVDFFDCVYPTRNGRHGHVYTNQGNLICSIKNTNWTIVRSKKDASAQPVEVTAELYPTSFKSKRNARNEIMCLA